MNTKSAQVRGETLMLARLVKFIIIVVMMASTFATQTQAATESGPIAVLDFVILNPANEGHLLLPGTFDGMANQIMTLDTSDTEVSGFLSVFQSHGTPLRPGGTLDLRRIRTTPAVLSSVSVKMHRRGATSTMFPKKSYALEFESTPSSFFATGRDWVLHSCYMDSTCLRNVIAYWQASQLFPWAPQTEFVEVFINGYYRGLYVVIEKIKLAPERVNLPEPTDNRITGGYILERASTDRPDSPTDWKSTVAPETFWSYVSPKKSLTDAQKSYIKRFMEVSFEPRFNRAFGNTTPSTTTSTWTSKARWTSSSCRSSRATLTAMSGACTSRSIPLLSTRNVPRISS